MCPASSSIASSCSVFSYRFFFFCFIIRFFVFYFLFGSLNTSIKIIFLLISYFLVLVANYLHQNHSKRDEKDIKTKKKKKIIREYMHKPTVLFAIAIFHLYPRSSPAWSVITNAKLILSYPDPKNSFRQPRNSNFHSQEPQIGILYCPRLTRVT